MERNGSLCGCVCVSLKTKRAPSASTLVAPFARPRSMINATRRSTSSSSPAQRRRARRCCC
eukprot:5518603-Prymnesium_polylepis.1